MLRYRRLEATSNFHSYVDSTMHIPYSRQHHAHPQLPAALLFKSPFKLSVLCVDTLCMCTILLPIHAPTGVGVFPSSDVYTQRWMNHGVKEPNLLTQ